MGGVSSWPVGGRQSEGLGCRLSCALHVHAGFFLLRLGFLGAAASPLFLVSSSELSLHSGVLPGRDRLLCMCLSWAPTCPLCFHYHPEFQGCCSFIHSLLPSGW